MVPRRLCICSLCVILACAPMNGIQQLVHSAPQFSLQKNAGGKSQLYSKMKLKRSFPENFLTTGGHFKHKIYRITAQGCMAEERNKEDDQLSFLVCHFKYM